MWKRILILSLCGSLYVSMWGSYLYFNATVVHNGEKIKLRDAVTHFIKSPAVKEFSKNLLGLWEHMKAQGFWSTWSQLVASLDPTGEKNALKVGPGTLAVLLKTITSDYMFRLWSSRTEPARKRSGAGTGS